MRRTRVSRRRRGGHFSEEVRVPITFNHGDFIGLEELQQHGWSKESGVDINKIKELFEREDIQYIAIAIQGNDGSTTECTVYARELLQPPINSPAEGYIRLKFSSNTLSEETICTNKIVNLYYKDK